MIIDYPWYYVILCLLVGIVYAVVLYFVGRRRFSKGMNLLLASLRFLAVSAIALLLLAPVAKQVVEERQKPTVVVAQDVSESVESGKWGVKSEAWKEFESEKYDVVYEEFGGSTTDIAAELSDIAARYQGRNLGAVVLSTDGIYNRGGNPASVAERLTFPVYTVALGDTTPQCDAALASVRHNRIAFLGSSFPLEVTVNASRLKGHSAQLSIHDSHGKQLAVQKIDYNDNRFSSTLTFNLQAKEAGLQRYTVRLSLVEGERERVNNTLSFFADVIDGRRKVLIVGDAPHPDLAAFKQAVESNPNYQVEMVLAADVENGKRKVENDVSLLILHNLPSSTHALSSFISQHSSLNTIFIIGLHTDLPRFNALHAGLEIVAKVKKSNEVTAVPNGQFSLFMFNADDAEVLEQLPPLTAPFGECKTSPGLQSFLTARLGSIDTRQPLVAALVQGVQRRAFVWGEGLWKWRLGDYLNSNSHKHFDQMVSQLVNFVALTDGCERFIVETDRHYAVGEEVVVGAQFYNESYELVNTPEATLTLKGESLKGDYTFNRRGNGYRLSFSSLPEGLYRYKASITYNGETFTDEGAFAVAALHLEQANLTADHSLLATVSAITGGEMVYPNQLSSLRTTLSGLKPIIYTHTRFSELLNLPWVMALILLLLGAEWVLRKYHGEI